MIEMADAVTEDIDSLKTCLLLLEDECQQDELRAALDILLKVHQNLLKQPGEEKYKQLRKENKTIKEKLLKFEGAKEFMLAAGWSEVDELFMYLDESAVRVDTVIQAIEEKLHTLPPVNVVKPVETHSSWTEEEMKQKDKRIEDDKQRRLEEYKRIKKEKDIIKQQIEADRKDANSREVKESHATNLGYGTFKKFENNRGG